MARKTFALERLAMTAHRSLVLEWLRFNFRFTLARHARLTGMSFNESPARGIGSCHFEDAPPARTTSSDLPPRNPAAPCRPRGSCRQRGSTQPAGASDVASRILVEALDVFVCLWIFLSTAVLTPKYCLESTDTETTAFSEILLKND